MYSDFRYLDSNPFLLAELENGPVRKLRPSGRNPAATKPHPHIEDMCPGDFSLSSRNTAALAISSDDA